MPEEACNQVAGPILSLDLGEKRVGAAVSDAHSISITPLDPIKRTNWKQLLQDVSSLVRRFDAQTLVIGLPLRLDGTTGDVAIKASALAKNFALSLGIPVYLQDERLTSAEAEENLRYQGVKQEQISSRVDSEAAALILRDFLATGQKRILVEPEIETER
ncbi:MAG TPA: Holliday junction resolvase RuvX [Pyrinomonadaceae bacterium]|nr:Holliday junction resolvase RuvX [Pyrinomonadaceae bacterium]